MIKITFKNPTIVWEHDYYVKVLFNFYHKINEGICFTKAYWSDNEFLLISNSSIKSIEHVKPTEL